MPGNNATPFFQQLFNKFCVGNRYTNTLHAITGAITKLSRVSKCDQVYRAPGGILPKTFWEEDPIRAKGGVEMGFMSTSKSKHAAMEYAHMSGVKLIFEIQQGMVSRGASISWLSMYPAEDEGSEQASNLIAAFQPLRSLSLCTRSWHLQFSSHRARRSRSGTTGLKAA